MSERQDGGPAFPTTATLTAPFGEWATARGSIFTMDGGLSIRDFFAAAALTGIMAYPGGDEEVDTMEVALGAYEFADAMLKAREKQ